MSRAVRGDNRRNHLSDAEKTRRASSPVRILTPEEITTMDPKKPTETKRIVVDELPREPDTVEQTKAQILAAVQSTARALHRKATKELQLLDEKELQSLNTISLILERIGKQSGPLDPSKLSDEEIERRLKE